ncbi:MAG: FAD-dependent oxidoreductase [Novosphingobium sp.]|nr:FAD-dependent oxidoreductase [Novosphingobium sp.]
MVASPAHAEWLEAATSHFVIAADTSEGALRGRATRLEQMHALLATISPDTGDNRLLVYLTNGISEVQDMAHRSDIGGYYVPTAMGAFAVSPRDLVEQSQGWTPEVVLFHEYTHHMLLQSNDAYFPGWVNEGLAELFATTQIKDNGDLIVGAANQSRAEAIHSMSRWSAERLLSSDTIKIGRDEEIEKYSRGALLIHYLIMDKTRAPLFAKFIGLVNRGSDPVAAGREAFGDLKALDRALDVYANRKQVTSVRYSAKQLPFDAAVTIRKLGADEAAALSLRLQSETDEDRKHTGELLAPAQRLAGRYPTSAAAQETLAQVSYEAGRFDEAGAAADRALALAPNDLMALLTKGRVLGQVALKSKSAADWAQARALFIRANRINPNHPWPFVLLYDSYGAAGQAAPPSIVIGLRRAVVLAPQDGDVRIRMAMELLRELDIEGARQMIAAVAYAPHGDADSPASKLRRLAGEIMHPRYPHVFSPVRLGPVELANRYYFSPHGLPLTVGPSPSNDLVAYICERIRGGTGLAILSCTAHERGRHYQPCPHPPESVPAFRALADAVHEAGGKIIAQIWYHWLSAGHWQPMAPAAPAFAPSVSQFAFGGVSGASHAATREEIRLMGEAHRQSARHLREAGFDGVEVHASHSGLIEQFLSPYFNHRTDEYGGTLENRMRLLIETIELVREGAGPELAVGMRLNCDELVQGGYHTSEAAAVLKAVCDRGLIDFADLDVAMEPLQLKYGMPTVFVEEHFYKPYVEKVRAAAGDVPVLSVLGRVTRMADAEAAIAAGVCDLVGSARQLLIEPKFVEYAREGTEERGRTCIACNWCLGGMADGAFGCTVNPASYRERLWGEGTLTPAARRSRVVVVGGGPGGLEAARVAALRGHEVTLIEAREALGGALGLWAKLPGREFYGHAIDWWERELARLGVDVRTGKQASAACVLALEPDAVIVATGARFSASGRSGAVDRDMPGADRATVFTPEDILEGRARPTGKVVLLDGEGTHAATGLAEMLGRDGAEVTLVSLNYAPYSNRSLMAFEGELMTRRMFETGATFVAATWVRSIGEREVTLYDIVTEHERRIEDVDAVVLATGRVSSDAIARDLDGKVAQLFAIGDALGVRPWATAAYEGQKFARLIGEEDAPATVGEAWFRADDPEVWPAPAG